MKVTVRTPSAERNAKLDDWRQYLKIEIDGQERFFVMDGEPEDNTLNRNFSDCYDIVLLMEQAYAAGKANEGFFVQSIEDGIDDDV